MASMIMPIMPFTADEVWREMKYSGLVHARHAISSPMSAMDSDDDIMTVWDRRLEYRSIAMGILEQHRSEFKNPQSARLVICAPPNILIDFRGFDFAEFVIVSDVEYKIADDFSIEVYPAEMEKCERCWRYLVTSTGELCPRCEDVISSCVKA